VRNSGVKGIAEVGIVCLRRACHRLHRGKDTATGEMRLGFQAPSDASSACLRVSARAFHSLQHGASTIGRGLARAHMR